MKLELVIFVEIKPPVVDKKRNNKAHNMPVISIPIMRRSGIVCREFRKSLTSVHGPACALSAALLVFESWLKL